jgi:hypothetical protein
MTTNWFTNRRKLRTWQRNISLVLLLFCFFDMVIVDVLFPEACERESTILGNISTSLPTAQSLSPIIHIPQEEQQTPTDSTPVEDDCFCCCAHIVPVEHFKFPPLVVQTSAITAVPQNLPTSPFTGLFRPPRLA